MKILVCKICGEEFEKEGRGRNPHTCSDECRKIAKDNYNHEYFIPYYRREDKKDKILEKNRNWYKNNKDKDIDKDPNQSSV